MSRAGARSADVGSSAPSSDDPAVLDDRERWDERYRSGRHDVPDDVDPLVRRAARLAPEPGRALDLACGPGRNALHLAERGHRVLAVDISREALDRLVREVRARNLPVWPVQADLGRFGLTPGSLDLVVDVHFLERAVFPVVRRALRPGGLVVVSTFTTREIDEFARELPRRLLLEPGELRRDFESFELLQYEESVHRRCGDRPRSLARMIARKPVP